MKTVPAECSFYTQSTVKMDYKRCFGQVKSQGVLYSPNREKRFFY